MSLLQAWIDRVKAIINPSPNVVLGISDDGSGGSVTVGKPTPLRMDPTTGELLVKSSGGGGGGGTVDQGTGAAVGSSWSVRIANAGASAFLTPLVAGENVLADLRVASAAVSNSNPVPISDAGGSITVDGTVTITPSGTQNVAAASQAATAFFPIRMSYDGSNFVGSGAVNTSLSLPTAVPYLGAYIFAKQTGATTGHSLICSSSGALLIAGQSAVNSTASSINPILVCGQTGASTVNLLCDSSGRQLVVGPGPSTAATSVSTVPGTITSTSAASVTPGSAKLVKNGAGRLRTVRVVHIAASTSYVQIHDVAAIASASSSTMVEGLVALLSGTDDEVDFDFGTTPHSFTNGCVVALSSTRDTYTASANTAQFYAQWE